MFKYNSYEEASNMKARISNVLLGRNENVVSVATEQVKTNNGAIIFSVKIALKVVSEAVEAEIMEQLKDAKIEPKIHSYTVKNNWEELQETFQLSGPIYASNVSAVDDINIPAKMGFLKSLWNNIANPLLKRIRPVHSGLSVGHEEATAGTIGAVITDQNGKNYIISNNHVLANTNLGKKGDRIIQPGPIDGGDNDIDSAAKLEYFSPIELQAETKKLAKNTTDVAIAILNDQNNINGNIPYVGKPVGELRAEIGMQVEKIGRTTNHTKGVVLAIDADVQVTFGGNQHANFLNQIKTSKMSKPGDSGSLLTTKSNGNVYAVGLLFAGSNHKSGHSYFNHFPEVISKLKDNGYYIRFATTSPHLTSRSLTWYAKSKFIRSPAIALGITAGLTVASYAAYNYKHPKPNNT